MRFRSFALGALFALPVAASAASQNESSPPPADPPAVARMADAQRAALARMLEEARNHGMEIRLSREIGIPAFVRGGDVPLTSAHDDHDDDRDDDSDHDDSDNLDEEHGQAGESQAVIAYLEAHSELFRLEDPERELALENVHTDELGGRNYRYQQQLDGVPVRGAELMAHFNAEGEMYALTANTVPTLTGIDTTPGVTANEASRIAGAPFTSTEIEQDVLLEIRRVDDEWRLVYAVNSTVDLFNRWMTVIDAESGDVLRHFLDHRDNSTAASGTDLAGTQRSFTAWEQRGLYYLIDATTPLRASSEYPLSGPHERGDTHVVDLLNTEGDSQQNVTSATAHSGWDSAAVSALVNSQAAWRYFRDRHSRASIDDRNASLLSAVHYGEDHDNAFWNGKWMVYGDGGRRFTSLAECLDVVAHEMTHGVIDHSADLVYENQSGALNESLADVFGVLAADDNWVVGEGCVKVEPGYLRSLADPHSGLHWQPAHMSEYVDKPNTEAGDHGGVHANSGIPNRAAYLLMEGLSAEGLGNSIGRRKAARLYYHAMTSYLLSGSEFIDLRRALLLSAKYLYPDSTTEYAAVAAAFDAVGIVEGGDVSGEGTGMSGLTASTRLLDFGDVRPGEVKSLSLRLENPTDTDIVIHEFLLDGSAFRHDFSNTRLGPGDSLAGRVSITGPSDAGTHAGTLEIHADGGMPVAIDLIATVTAPSVGSVPPGDEQSPARSASGGGGVHPFFMLLLLFGLRRRANAA